MNRLDLINERKSFRGDFNKIITLKLPADARDEAWTPIEVFYHVILANRNIQKILQRLISKSKNPEEDFEFPVWPVKKELIDFPIEKAFSIDAVPGTEPDKYILIENLWKMENSINEEFDSLLDYASKYNCESLDFSHPLLGKLNFYEWLYFETLHESYHLKRLKNDLRIL